MQYSVQLPGTCLASVEVVLTFVLSTKSDPHCGYRGNTLPNKLCSNFRHPTCHTIDDLVVKFCILNQKKLLSGGVMKQAKTPLMSGFIGLTLLGMGCRRTLEVMIWGPFKNQTQKIVKSSASKFIKEKPKKEWGAAPFQGPTYETLSR
jgi:hypothetical protein